MTLSIQQAIDSILSTVPGAPFPGTVDTVKLGDPSQPLKRIAVTFLASMEVIEQAIQLGANFLITHEPTFYNHLDEVDFLTSNPVYAAKRRLIAESGLVIWRFHDALHSMKPDPINVELIRALGWAGYELPGRSSTIRLPAPMPLRQLAQHVKTSLDATGLRVVGELDRPCQTVSLSPGSPGVRAQLGLLGQPGVDVLLAGEIFEWETSEFARDARRQAAGKGLIVTGHAASEEPGMRWLAPWLEQRFPGVPVTFIHTGSAFQTL